MLVCHVAVSSQKTGGYLKKLQASSKHHEDVLQCCLQRNVNPGQPIFKIGIEYLTQYLYTGVGYSSVTRTRSVLSSIIKPENGTSFEEDSLACILLKGVFNLRPSLLCYTTT